mgnify:CR=1 FL=1
MTIVDPVERLRRAGWVTRAVALGGLCLLLQQVPVSYRIDFFGQVSDGASLIHLHAGLLLAIALLERDRRVVAGCFLLTFAGWTVRQLYFNDWRPGAGLLWGGATYAFALGWSLACARWMEWPRPDGQRVMRRDLVRFAAIGLLLGAAPLAIAQENFSANDIVDALTPKEAQEKGCRSIEGTPITVLQPPRPPKYPAAELHGVIPTDTRKPFVSIKHGWQRALRAFLAMLAAERGETPWPHGVFSTYWPQASADSFAPQPDRQGARRHRRRLRRHRLSVQTLGMFAIFFTGMLLMAYNTWRTVQAAKPAEMQAAAQMA